MAAEIVAALISLLIALMSVTKFYNNRGWKKVAWTIIGLLFFLSWLGNSFRYFGVIGWIGSLVLIVVVGTFYAKKK